MVAREAALEGGFRTHARLIAHAEEIALLKGGERKVCCSGLDNLVTTQRWHALQRVRKSVADNISKFQGLLVEACSCTCRLWRNGVWASEQFHVRGDGGVDVEKRRLRKFCCWVKFGRNGRIRAQIRRVVSR